MGDGFKIPGTYWIEYAENHAHAKGIFWKEFKAPKGLSESLNGIMVTSISKDTPDSMDEGCKGSMTNWPLEDPDANRINDD